jgi:hypothetical protein
MTDVAATATTPETDRPVTCFGRFMVDLPADATTEIAAMSMYRFGYIESEKTTLDQKAFTQTVEQHASKYRGMDVKKNRTLKQTISPSPFSKIVVTAEDVFGTLNYGFDMFKLERDVMFSMSVKNYEENVMRDVVLPDLQTRVLPSLRARRPDEIPTDSGLCIRDGFIASDGSERALEAVNLSLSLQRWPDLRLSISTATEHKAGPSLLERRKNRSVPDVFKVLIGQVRTLREGRHDVGALRAEESLVTMPTDDGYRIHMFRWESIPELNDPFDPSIIVKLESGVGLQGERRPTITDKEALDLFSAVVNSIRLRPTKPIKSSATEPPKAPQGTVSTTGHRCPQSGLWCAEEGEQRFITEDEPMPRTSVVVAQNFWQRLRGESPVRARATHWTLTAL